MDLNLQSCDYFVLFKKADDAALGDDEAASGEVVLTDPGVGIAKVPPANAGGVPTSDFFRGILEYYKLQLVHLNPNGVLHMSIFVHLCEVYLGVPPSLELLRKSPFSKSRDE